MGLTPKALLRAFGGTLVVLSILTACSTMFKTSEEIEADRIALEINRAQVPGSSGAAFTPDGNLVAIGTRDMIWVGDPTTGQRVARLSHERASRFGGRKSLQFINERLLLIAADGAIYLWDLHEGLIKDRYQLANSLQSPRAMAWSGAAQMLAISSGSTMQPVTLVHVGEDGFGASQSLAGIEGVPADLIFSRDGIYMALTGDEQGVLVKKVQSGETVGELPTSGFVDNLELFGENKLLVSGSDIALWTFLQQKEKLALDNPEMQSQIAGQLTVKAAETVVMGSLIAVGAVACAFGACDGAALGNLVSDSYSVASTPVDSSRQPWCGRSTSASPDGKWLVDVFPGVTNEVVRIFDLRSGQLAKTLNPAGEYHCIAKFSPDSKQLLITSSKGALLYATDTWQRRDIRLEY